MKDHLTLTLFESFEDVLVAQEEGSLVSTQPSASTSDNVLEAEPPCAPRNVLDVAPITGASSKTKPVALVALPSSAMNTPSSPIEPPFSKDEEGWTRWQSAAEILAHIAIRAASSSSSSPAPTQ